MFEFSLICHFILSFTQIFTNEFYSYFLTQFLNYWFRRISILIVIVIRLRFSSFRINSMISDRLTRVSFRAPGTLSLFNESVPFIGGILWELSFSRSLARGSRTFVVVFVLLIIVLGVWHSCPARRLRHYQLETFLLFVVNFFQDNFPFLVSKIVQSFRI